MRILLAFFLLLFALPCFAVLDSDTCASLIVNQIKTKNPTITGSVETDLVAYWKLICTGLITHITTSAVVTVSTTGVTGTGSPGGPLPITSQPGTGTVQ